MTTKQYLEQISRYERKINNELAELDYYKELAKGISSVTNSNVKVKSSGNKDVLEKRVIKVIEIEQKIDELIDGYVDNRRNILSQIQELENNIESEVLYLKYYKRQTIEEIGRELGYSRTGIYNILKSALKNFEKQYKNHYKNL